MKNNNKVVIKESTLRNIVREAVENILNEYTYSGRVGNDGNHMVGGSWGHTSGIDGRMTLNVEDIFFEVLGDASEDCNASMEYLVTAKFGCGYDDSVGLGNYTEFESNPQIDDEFYNDVDNLNCSDEQKQELINKVEDKVENLYEGDFDVDCYEY